MEAEGPEGPEKLAAGDLRPQASSESLPLFFLFSVHCSCPSTVPRHVNPKISPVVRILPAPWGLPGGNWWLPLSHRVVGAPEPPSVTSVSGQETTSSICDHGGGVPRRVRGAVQKPSPPPLRPRAPFNNPPGPPCAAGVAPGGPTHPWPCPPQVQLLRSKPGASARSAMGERAVQTILRKKEPSK